MFGGIRVNKADVAWSLYVREKAGWKCEYYKRDFSMNHQGLSCSHFFGRRAQATRFCPDNTFAICTGCHIKFHDSPNAHRDWVYKKLGPERFAALVVRNNSYKKRDDKMAYIVAKRAYLDLCKEKGIEPFKV